MLTPGKTYEDVYHSFQWQIPEFYNIGVDICDRWAEQGKRLALAANGNGVLAFMSGGVSCPSMVPSMNCTKE